MSKERNALPKAMNVVIAAMQADPGYAWSWHCNVAMAYVDAGGNRDVANQGAARFMKLLANVEPAHDILPTQTPDTKLNEQGPVAWESILGAVARGWCYEENANKTMDSELAVAIAKEVHALYTAPPQLKPLLASDIVTMYDENPRSDSEMIAFARAIEAAHGIKGEA